MFLARHQNGNRLPICDSPEFGPVEDRQAASRLRFPFLLRLLCSRHREARENSCRPRPWPAASSLAGGSWSTSCSRHLPHRA